MKAKTTVLLVSVLLLATAGYTQSNSCAYTFTYPKSHFSFCVTVWGTLASIQSPIGVDHLDSLNPVEGWTALIIDDGGGGDGGVVIPGLGTTTWTNPPAVQQPNGPGTLPLIFDYEGTSPREIISADPSYRTVYITLIIRSCGDCFWSGSVSRVANTKADGNSTNTFGHSAFAAFGYFNHGLMLSVGENTTTNACAGIDPNGTSTSAYLDCGTDTLFTGTGGRVFTHWTFVSYLGSPVTMKATYRVF